MSNFTLMKRTDFYQYNDNKTAIVVPLIYNDPPDDDIDNAWYDDDYLV
jgi:hypothetical protein